MVIGITPTIFKRLNAESEHRKSLYLEAWKYLHGEWNDIALLVLVAEGVKPAAEICPINPDLEKIFKKLNIHYRTVRGKSTDYYVIGKDEDIVNELTKAFSIHKHNHSSIFRIGFLLGFPRCCVATFTEEKAESAVRYHNQMHTPDHICSFDDLNKIFHVPCNPDCVESKIIAAKYWKTLEEMAPAIAKKLEARYTKITKAEYCKSLIRKQARK